MRLHHALDDLFASASHVRVLRVLVDMGSWPGSSTREIARRAGITHPTAARVLSSLVEQGVVHRRLTASSSMHELNMQHGASQLLLHMFAWEGALMGGLRSFLAARLGALVPRATQAFIYGSTARAREGLSSDLDVAVILPPGSKPPVEDSVLALMGEVTDRYGIRLELVIGTGSLESLQRSDRRGYRLWRAIAQEGIPIFERAA